MTRVAGLVAVMSLTCLPMLANGSELLDAIRRADTKQVRAMLQAGANPDLRDAGGVPALMRAVVYLPAKDVRLFIDRGADVNASSGSGATALMWAAPDTGKVRLLLDRGARPDLRAKDGATALVAAARFGNSDAMRLLLARGADPQASANGALDLLRIAYGRNDRTMRQLLADAGIRPADPKQLPGALASSIEQPEAVKTLLNAGADPNEPVAAGNHRAGVDRDRGSCRRGRWRLDAGRPRRQSECGRGARSETADGRRRNEPIGRGARSRAAGPRRRRARP